MIIVKLMGGMGNQMFQYAAGRRLAIKHKTILKLDLTFLLDRTPRENFTYRDYDLDVFNIKEYFASASEINRFVQDTGLIDKIKRKLRMKVLIQEPHFNFFQPLLSAPRNSYLEGYWQSEKYFKDIEQVIRNEFTLKSDLDYDSKKMADKIISSEAVCLNVRRADYVNNPILNKVYSVCDLEYYFKCIDYISERVSNPQFFIFSDDIEWCKNNLPINWSSTIVSHKYAGKKFEYYLKLMTLCKHYIIPNSTFAWWAAWLNENPKKIVIAPEKWFNHPSKNTDDLIPKTWIKI